ncbi:MAG TPA: hypothetical protein VFG69_09805 [Nannocystaceae bacterium]|nr:hypothetical protein [Nannocystaceae bacterium]
MLALAPAGARAGAPDAAAPTSSTAQGEKVDLDLSGLEPIDPSVRADLAKQIHAAVENIVAQHGVPAEKIHLDVAWRDADQFDYAVGVVFDKHGVLTERKHGTSTGPDTEQGELADVVAANLERYLGEWDAARAREEERLAALRAAEGAQTHDVAPELPRPRRLGRLGWTGVALVVAGAGATAAGGALVGVGETPEPDAATKLRDWKPAGYGLLATGGALLVTGIVLVVVDAVPRARARRSGGSHAMLAPALGRRHAGVQLRFRF